MSAFTIGRVGVDTSAGGDGTTLQHPFDWSQQGRMVTLAGVHQAASDAAAVWLQQQILGLDPANNPDEEWVPVTSATVADLNGFFRVNSASAVIPAGSLGNGTKVVQWSVQMERAPAWRRPRIELPTIYAGIANGMGVTTRMSTQALPTGTVERWGMSGASYTTTRASEHGTVDLHYYDGSTISYVSKLTTTASWAPGSHYSGGVSIEKVGVGKVVGRLDAPVSDGWRIGNGLVRLKVDTTGNTLTFEFWNGSAWTGTKALAFDSYITSGPYTWDFRRLSVLRNDPTECVLRVAGAGSISGWMTMDIAVRRGQRVAHMYMAGEGLYEGRMKFNTNTACTATTWGLRTTSTVNGQYLLMMSDYASDKLTPSTNGKLSAPSSLTTNSTLVFGIGASGDGTVTGSGIQDEPECVNGVSKQWYGVVGETQRVAF